MLNYDKVLEWAESRFQDIKTDKKEIKVNSIFTVDAKQHLWICPSKNAFHCWKSNKSGKIFELVMLVDGCTEKEAKKKLGNNSQEVKNYEHVLNNFFSKKVANVIENKVKLPEHSFLISKLPENSASRLKSEKYLIDRKIPIDGLYFCIKGKYSNRIIIPYYGSKGELIYFNGRDITNNAPERYKGPNKEEVGLGKEDVLFMPNWNIKDRIYVTEGEFDAMILKLCGYSVAACGGKEIGDKQISILRKYNVTIAFDHDKSGKSAINKLAEKLEKNGLKNVNYVMPPEKYKDWNKMFQETDLNVIRDYIQINEAPLNFWTSLLLL